jgi:hypothetical protein
VTLTNISAFFCRFRMPPADAGRQRNKDCRHLPLSGANCDRDDHTKVVFAQLLARQLERLLMVMTAESVKGRAVLPLLLQPSMLVASHLAALLQAGLSAADRPVVPVTGRVERFPRPSVGTGRRLPARLAPRRREKFRCARSSSTSG